MYQIGGRQVLEGPSQVRADFTVDLMNRNTLQELFAIRDDAKGPTASRFHTVHLCISDSDDKVVAYRKLRDEELLKQPLCHSVTFSKSEKEPKNKFTISLRSESWIGIDIARRDFTLHFAFLEANVDVDLFPGAANLSVQPQVGPELPLPDEASVAVMIADEQAPSCNHKCKDKSLCLHDCCKTSAQVRRAMKENFPMQKSAVAAKRLAKSAGHYAIRKGINVTQEANNWFQEPDEAEAREVAPSSGPRLEIQTSGVPLPDTGSLPFFPKPVSFSATKSNTVSPNIPTPEQIPQPAAQTSRTTRTPRKRRSVFIEEDEEDDGFEVVIGNRLPDRPFLSPSDGTFLSPAGGRELAAENATADMAAAATAATCDPSPGLATPKRLDRFAVSPEKRYRTVAPTSTWQSPEAISHPKPELSAYERQNRLAASPVNRKRAAAVSAQWSSPAVVPVPQPEQSAYERLSRFTASPVRKYRTQVVLPVRRRNAAERGMDFRNNLTPVANPIPEPVSAGVAHQFGMNFVANGTPILNPHSPATPRSLTAKERGMDFKTFDQSTPVTPHKRAAFPSDPTSAAPLFPAGGDLKSRMKVYDDGYEKMLSEVNAHDDELDLLIKQLMQDD